jgi:two-component system, OmpR family, response regulator PhoP
MQTGASVVVYDKIFPTKVRIRKIFEDNGIKVEDTSNQLGLLNILSKNAENKVVVIIAIEEEADEDNFEMLRTIKNEYPDFSVIVLTSVSKREFFTRCIIEGAADYVLKPFEDYFLFERVLKLLNPNTVITESVLKFNFPGYLRSEIFKARKGGYQFSLMKCTLTRHVDDKYSIIEHDYLKYANSIYEGLKTLFWETDIFIQFGLDSFLGFFPFCGNENIIIIDEKVKSKYAVIQSLDENLRNYEVVNSFATYPLEGQDVSTLLNLLTTKINAIINV